VAPIWALFLAPFSALSATCVGHQNWIIALKTGFLGPFKLYQQRRIDHNCSRPVVACREFVLFFLKFNDEFDNI